MRISRLFSDRAEAGRALGAEVAGLLRERGLADPVVLALPRGGVPVACGVQRALSAPLDLVFVRKIGVPGEPELAAAAVVDGERPVIVRNEGVIQQHEVPDSYLAEEAAQELAEIARRRTAYLAGRRPLPLEGRTAVVVDDGLATGTTMRAVLQALRRSRVGAIVLAVPVAPAEVIADLRSLVDGIVCLASPEPFHAIGLHYADFHQLPDAEVISLLAASEASS